MSQAVEVKDVTKKYGSKTAVSHLNLSVKQGEVFGLLGHNGAGKSTTIDCILGLKKLDGGEVKILGMDPKKDRKRLFEQVGVQLQSSAFQLNIRVKEVCEEMSCLYQNPLDYKVLLRQFGLEAMENQMVDKLSGGERQKLSVLLALIPQPKVIFLDELTTGLDTVARREVWKVLKQLKEKGTTIFLTSHYMDEVESLCDRILILKSGEALVSGTVKEVISSSPYENLENTYLWYMG